MNKNLKKVISSVAALSMVASSVAALAANFPDVADDAYYAQAVQELTALDVISGFEDGTFKPDELVTRAQITKMVVDALAEGGQAEASKNTKSFDDVAVGESGHWAAGYINQGVADGWIAGMGDGTFAPDANVTYVQAQKMLVAAVGYDTYATAQGGWPTGYKMYGSSLKITNGVQGVSSDEQELTRAQVAKMINNAMDAPLCVIDGWKLEWNGTKTPNLKVKNGTGKDYQTLFTDKHDTYKVFGRVTNTSKSSQSGDIDKVDFDVEKADNFDDEEATATNVISITPYKGDTNADDMLNVYAQALIQKDDNDEFTILSITPAAASKSITLASEDFDKYVGGSKCYLYFFPAGTTRNSVKYRIADEMDCYVNGVEASMTNEQIAAYLEANDTASVTLIKKTETGSTATEAEYGIIMISAYETAVVDYVQEKASKSVVYFSDQSEGINKASMEVLDDDNTVEYNFTLDGKAIEVTDLEENDVLNIAFNTTEDFNKSNFYDVIVTRDTAEGKCSSIADDEYTIGGTKYKVASGMSLEPELSSDYVLYLDHFGRIAAFDESAVANKLAILKNVYQKSNKTDWEAEIVTNEGQELTKVINNSKKLPDGTPEDVKAFKDVYDAATAGSAFDPTKAVISYTINSSDRISMKKPTGADDKGAWEVVASETEEPFKKSSNKIGSIRLSDTSVIMSYDSEADEYKVISADSLKDGIEYTAYGYDKSKSDGIYRYVILIDAEGALSSTSKMAVIAAVQKVEDGDDTVIAYDMFVGDEEVVTYKVSTDDEDDFGAFAIGDAVVFEADGDNYITAMTSVFASEFSPAVVTDYDNFKANYEANKAVLTAGLDEELTDNNDDVEVVFGAILDKSNGEITLSSAKELTFDGSTGLFSDINEGTSVSITSDTKVYSYDYSVKRMADRVEGGAAVEVTSVTKNDRYKYTDKTAKDTVEKDPNGDVIALDNIYEVVFAVARVIDDEAQEIYVILPAEEPDEF